MKECTISPPSLVDRIESWLTVRTQRRVEKWVRREWLPARFSQEFHRERRALSSGGEFGFGAVSADEQIIACISTSRGKTSGKKFPTGQVNKLRGDMLFLIMAKAEQRFIVLTDEGMFELCEKEREKGRVPRGIDFLLARLPQILRRSLPKRGRGPRKKCGLPTRSEGGIEEASVLGESGHGVGATAGQSTIGPGSSQHCRDVRSSRRPLSQRPGGGKSR